jgi:PAS domain S-box-containing protein
VTPIQPGPSLPVLIVDDDDAFGATLVDILRLRGYEPHAATSAHAALRLAHDINPAVAILDLQLPDMHGMELMSRIHASSRATSVIVLTGNATLETAIAALREKSVDYLLKPVDVAQLLEVVSDGARRWQLSTSESQLRASEERYRHLFDQNPQPLWVFDRETLRFVAVNDAATRHYGYTREELLGMKVADIRPPEDIAAFVADVSAPQRQQGRVWRHRKKDGTIIEVEIVAHDFMFAGRPSRIALVHDVTERRRQERALMARTAQQAAVAEFGQYALSSEDMKAMMQRATEVVARVLDVPLAAVLERQTDDHQLVMLASTGWNADGVRFRSSAMLLEHGAVSGTAVDIPGARHAFGVLSAQDWRQHHFSSDDVHFLQAIANIIGSAVARNTSEIAMRQSQRLEAVGQLTGGMAHDFNNVLTAIAGFAELVKSGMRPDDASQQDVDEILRATERAGLLTKQLLAFSRKQVLQPRVLDLNEVVREIENMLRRLLGSRIETVIYLEPALELVMADPGQLQQVLVNLSVNARDAMPEGGVLRIETRNSDDGRHAVLIVSDTGIGMDDETRLRIFEPFFTTKGDKGTGLGLATVYGIVKQSGGEIAVSSQVGAGTTFRVSIPRALEL